MFKIDTPKVLIILGVILAVFCADVPQNLGVFMVIAGIVGSAFKYYIED